MFQGQIYIHKIKKRKGRFQVYFSLCSIVRCHSSDISRHPPPERQTIPAPISHGTHGKVSCNEGLAQHHPHIFRRRSWIWHLCSHSQYNIIFSVDIAIIAVVHCIFTFVLRSPPTDSGSDSVRVVVVVVGIVYTVSQS